MADEVRQNPNLMSREAMMRSASTTGNRNLMISEILTRVNNAKDKPKKVEILRQNKREWAKGPTLSTFTQNDYTTKNSTPRSKNKTKSYTAIPKNINLTLSKNLTKPKNT